MVWVSESVCLKCLFPLSALSRILMLSVWNVCLRTLSLVPALTATCLTRLPARESLLLLQPVSNFIDDPSRFSLLHRKDVIGPHSQFMSDHSIDQTPPCWVRVQRDTDIINNTRLLTAVAGYTYRHPDIRITLDPEHIPEFMCLDEDHRALFYKCRPRHHKQLPMIQFLKCLQEGYQPSSTRAKPLIQAVFEKVPMGKGRDKPRTGKGSKNGVKWECKMVGCRMTTSAPFGRIFDHFISQHLKLKCHVCDISGW